MPLISSCNSLPAPKFIFKSLQKCKLKSHVRILTIIGTISKLAKVTLRKVNMLPKKCVGSMNKIQWPMRENTAFWCAILSLNNNKRQIILWRSQYTITQTITLSLYQSYWLRHKLKAMENLRKRTFRHLCGS